MTLPYLFNRQHPSTLPTSSAHGETVQEIPTRASSPSEHGHLLHIHMPQEYRNYPRPLKPLLLSEKIEPKPVEWGIYWRSPTLMMSFFVLGIAFAVAHHFYYDSLDGRIVPSKNSQEWAIRIGTAMAFLSKTFFTAAVGIACTQRLWVVLKAQPISLQALNNVFALTTDPIAFLSYEVLFGAKLLCLLAAAVW